MAWVRDQRTKDPSDAISDRKVFKKALFTFPKLLKSILAYFKILEEENKERYYSTIMSNE